jgi:hypothetical protein
MFRLVTLYAGPQSEKVRCKLTESPLSSPTPYNALSYVWGSTRDPGGILLDSQEYLVTRNLFEALKELRLPDSDKVLWVDALCINQSDIAERGAQVMSMDSVYEKAIRVIAWLGPYESDSALTFELLQKVELSGGGDPSLFLEGLRGLPPLLAREYWSRAWIIQEMEFARELRIWCGPDEASYSTLFKLKNSLLEGTSVITELKAPPRDLRHSRNVSVQRSSPSVFSKQIPELGLARSGQGLSPVTYLDRLIQSKCSKRHDSVLAFYNLFNVGIRIRIKSYKEGDVYEMPPDKFLIQAMRAIIEVTQSLYILTIKARQLGPNIEELWQRDMPSWCPYFGTSFKSVSIPHANDISFDTTTKAINFLDDGTTLRANGFRIGTISRTVRRDPRSIGQFQPLVNENDITKKLEYIHKCMDFVSSLIGKADGDGEAKEEALEAIRQTLLAGEDTDALREVLRKVKKADDNERFKYENLGARCEHTLNEVKKYTHTRVICSFTVTPTLRYNSDIHVALVPDTVRRGDVICYV